MADTVAKQIVAALAARLAEIQTENGYNTDAGLRVYRSRARLVAGEDDLPALCIYLAGESFPSRHERRVDIDGEIVIEGHIADPSAPAEVGDALQDLAGDIKTALFPNGEAYRYIAEGGQALVTDFWPASLDYQPPDLGGQTASLRLSVQARWPENLGDPYTVI